MSEPLKYGDTVTILNIYNNWQGYLSVYDFRTGTNLPTFGTKHDVCTLDASYMYGRIWRIESGIGKKTGCDVVDGDIIQLQNLYQCDGGYLECHEKASLGGGGASEIYQIHTDPLAGRETPQSHQQWRINLKTKVADCVLRTDDLFMLENQYGPDAGVLDVFGLAGKAPAVNNVFTSNNKERGTAWWKMQKVTTPCPDLPPRDGPNNGCNLSDTDPRMIPGLPQNTQLTVTLINNEQWIRTATLNIDGKDQTLEVTGNKAVSKAFTSGNGAVLFSLIDSQKGAMRIPLNLSVIPLGASGNSMTFGSEKPTGETVPRYMDVFVHIDWETKITN